MPTEINFYLVRFVSLINGTFKEIEMNDTQLDIFKLTNKIKGEPLQIVNKQYLRTKNLITGYTYS